MTASYLLRTEADGIAPSVLVAFTEDDESRLLPRELLTGYLRHLILLNHYSLGMGPLIKRFWRWNDDDTVQELELRMTTETPELDGETDQYYRVLVKDTDTEVARFTVRIK